METLYDQLIKLQHIPHAYEEWASYREALTELIIRHTRKGSSAALIGAGECNDFDLHRIAGQFSPITLLDHHDAAVRLGLDQQGVRPDLFHVVKADLLGISDAAYRAMDDVLLREIRKQPKDTKDTSQAFTQRFLSQMQAAFLSRKPDAFIQEEAVADYVICCGVHSQLLNMFPQMATVYHRYIDFDIDAVYAAVKAMNAIAARELNARLLHMARLGVILGLEENRVGIDGGIEGAAQALQDIRRSSAPIVFETALLWPFDPSQKKAYRTRILIIEKP